MCYLWPRLKKTARTTWMEAISISIKKGKKLLCLQKQAKSWSYRTTPKYKFGYQISRRNDYGHILSIDKRNGNKIGLIYQTAYRSAT